MFSTGLQRFCTVVQYFCYCNLKVFHRLFGDFPMFFTVFFSLSYWNSMTFPVLLFLFEKNNKIKHEK